jgi:hypothetical protein
MSAPELLYESHDATKTSQEIITRENQVSPFYLFIYLFIYFCISLFIYLFIYFCIHLFVYLFGNAATFSSTEPPEPYVSVDENGIMIFKTHIYTFDLDSVQKNHLNIF